MHLWNFSLKYNSFGIVSLLFPDSNSEYSPYGKIKNPETQSSGKLPNAFRTLSLPSLT